MTINGINGANTGMGQMGPNQAADSYSKNIQNQIANAQKQLQELSSNEDMALEEKMKKRQEIQQQISDLNMQLRQHQIEQRKEMQQAKSSSMDDMSGARSVGNTKAGSNGTGFSQAGMTALISADSSMKLAKAQGSVAKKIEGRAGILESEIKLDRARGGDTKKKEEELADMKQKAQEATSSQLSTLADANKTMEEAAKADSQEEKADSRAEKEDDKAKETEARSDAPVSNGTVAAGTTSQRPAPYMPVDIRL